MSNAVIKQHNLSFLQDCRDIMHDAAHDTLTTLSNSNKLILHSINILAMIKNLIIFSRKLQKN